MSLKVENLSQVKPIEGAKTNTVEASKVKGRKVYDITNPSSLNSKAPRWVAATVIIIIAVMALTVALFVSFGSVGIVAASLCLATIYTVKKAHQSEKEAPRNVADLQKEMIKPEFKAFAARFDRYLDLSDIRQVVDLFKKHQAVTAAEKTPEKVAEMDKEVRKLRREIRKINEKVDGIVQKRGLIIVDMQNDFALKSKFAGKFDGPKEERQGADGKGALYVKDGEAIIPIISEIHNKFKGPVFWTKDWHPPTHMSFQSNNEGSTLWAPNDKLNGQVMWTDHCVQHEGKGTKGSEICEGLSPKPEDKIIYKGTNAKVESYSGFFDNDHISQTELDDLLWDAGVTAVDVVGLAYDFCVGCSALDAAALGVDTRVLRYASKPVFEDKDPSGTVGATIMTEQLLKAQVEIVDKDPAEVATVKS